MLPRQELLKWKRKKDEDQCSKVVKGTNSIVVFTHLKESRDKKEGSSSFEASNLISLANEKEPIIIA